MIRHATPDDIAALTGIYNEAIAEGGYTGDLEPVTVESRAAWYADHQGKYAVFVMEVDGLAAGYVALSPYRKGREAFRETCEISYYVYRRYRGRGLGKDLIERGKIHAAGAGFKVMVGILLGSNARSIRLLESFGFSECGRVKMAAKIAETYDDHVFMSHCFDDRKSA